ncbi:MAG TPA: histidine ammonia-lyase, partial [Candidatus Dormibacteraeota bacterium]|nr:histidine ammonia-lyase [Candidatus Dormibacteraeota bacterium]
ALDLHAPLKASPAITALREELRKTVAFVDGDRPLSDDVKSTARRILAGEFVGTVETALGNPVR